MNVIYKILGAVFLKGGGVLASFAFQYYLAKYLGAAGVGKIGFLLSCIFVLGGIVTLGSDISIQRLIGANVGVHGRGILKYFVFSILLCFVSTIAVSVIFFGIDFFYHGLIDKIVLDGSVFVLLLFLYSVVSVVAAALQGLSNSTSAFLCSGFLIPVFSFCWFYFIPQPSEREAAHGFLIGVVVSLIVGLILLHYRTRDLKEATNFVDVSPILFSGIPAMGGSVVQLLIVNTPIFLLGFLGSEQELGAYSLAQKVISVLGIVLIIGNAILAPRFALLAKREKSVELESLLRKSTLWMFFVSVPFFVCYFVFPGWLLAWFGKDFERYYFIVILLAFGELFNIATGEVGFLLLMAGKEKCYFYINLVFYFIGAVLSWFLYKPFGVFGVAAAVSATTILVNMARVLLVKKIFCIRQLIINPSLVFNFK